MIDEQERIFGEIGNPINNQMEVFKRILENRGIDEITPIEEYNSSLDRLSRGDISDYYGTENEFSDLFYFGYIRDEISRVENLLELLDYDENGKLKITNLDLSQECITYLIARELVDESPMLEDEETYLENVCYKLFSIHTQGNQYRMKMQDLNIDEKDLVKILGQISKIKQLIVNTIIDGEPLLNSLIQDENNRKRLLMKNKELSDEIFQMLVNGKFGDFSEKDLFDIIVSCESLYSRLLKGSTLLDTCSPELKGKIRKLDTIIQSPVRDIDISYPEIPNGMCVGIEFESLGPASYLASKMGANFNFEEHGEASLSDDLYKGVELVSPILTKETIKNAPLVAYNLGEMGQVVNKTCGLHIHIDSKFLNIMEGEQLNLEATKLAWMNFLKLFSTSENIMYKLANNPEDSMRDTHFCSSIKAKIDEVLSGGIIEKSSSLSDLKEKIRETQFNGQQPGTQRYFSVNFSNLASEDSPERIDTIEFRLSGGTLNPQSVSNTINLYANFMEVSKILGVIDYKISQGQELTPKEKQYLELRELVLNHNSDEERAEDFINLISKNSDEIVCFRDRYQGNKTEESIRTQEYLFDESDFDELAEKTITDMPNLYSKVLNYVKKFINTIRGVDR